MYAPSKPGDEPSVEVNFFENASLSKPEIDIWRKSFDCGFLPNRNRISSAPTLATMTEVWCSGVERVYDVSEQAAFRVLPRQGALLPRGNNFSQCAHPGKSDILSFFARHCFENQCSSLVHTVAK